MTGTWGRIRCGSTTGLFAADAKTKLSIYGGEFYDIVIIGGIPSAAGYVDAAFYGGTYYGGIYGLDNVEPYSLSGQINLRIEGGTYYGFIAPGLSRDLPVSGTWNVYVEGGDFSHLTDLVGSGEYEGKMESHFYAGKNAAIDKPPEGTITFKNPLRVGADPWIFYHDGFYYLTVTGRKGVALYKAANLPDLVYGPTKVVYDPPEYTDYHTNMWSPEIHYFTDEEAGNAGAGWYMFISSGSGAFNSNRAYVVKCLTDDLLGPWGDPVTGQRNIAQRVVGRDDATINAGNAGLTAGMSRIKINGTTYLIWVGEEDRGTENYHQIIYINKMLNPWTPIGKKAAICVPEYPWEKQGHAYDQVRKSWYPMVVEGSTAVYGNTGETYIVYSGSGYWTRYYQLGLLAYKGGDPLDKASWQKKPEPVFSLSDTINGCGHASYVTDVDGNKWICYHAYLGQDTQSGRYVFLEPYHADAEGVHIGNQSGHPASLDTEYTVKVNPIPLRKKIHGFASVE
jgi:GH43 family beta-xylosidase